MRIESSVTSLSWIPSEAIGGLTKMPFETGMAHYDPPPPDVIEDLDELQREGGSGSPIGSRRGSRSTAAASWATASPAGGCCAPR